MVKYHIQSPYQWRLKVAKRIQKEIQEHDVHKFVLAEQMNQIKVDKMFGLSCIVNKIVFQGTHTIRISPITKKKGKIQVNICS